MGHFGVLHFLLRKWSLIGYRIWGSKFGLQRAMCACDGGLLDVPVAFFAAALPCTYVGSLSTRFDGNCCGRFYRPSCLAPNVVPTWVLELGSEFWFALGHVCMRKVLLNVSCGVFAAAVPGTPVGSLSSRFHGNCVS